MNKYQATWTDVDGRKKRTRFWAAELADAVELCEDLAAITAASWTELEENGGTVTVTSPAFGQPAGTEAYAKEMAVLEVRGASSRARHSLRLPAVRPEYVNATSSVTRQNPFRALGKWLSAEGEPAGTFVRGTYRYETKDTKNW